MIDLTPLDVRNKRGDFKRLLRGYDPQEVDTFLELAAERLEALVRENISLRERAEILQQQVDAQTGRERAIQDALVTAQQLRTDVQEQARREAEHVVREAHTEGRRMLAEAEAEVRTRLRDSERRASHGVDVLAELERRRARFLRSFRQLLERELDVVEVEEGRPPLEERTIDLDLGAKRGGEGGWGEAGAPAAIESRLADLEPQDPILSLDDLRPDETTAAGIEPTGSPARAEDGSLGERGAPPIDENLLLYLSPDDERRANED